MVITGVYYALAFCAAGFAVAWLTRPWIAAPLFVLAAFFLWFFRDPDREAPLGPDMVSPADGKVMTVKMESDGLTRISIFLSPLDVHVNRTPVGGRIVDFEHKKGEFLIASAEEASARNEQNVITVEMEDGVKVVYKQIAGVVARRCVFDRKIGDVLRKGERIGLMKFGSRMDVIFGVEWQPVVRPGDRVWAATSVLARRKAV